MHLFRDGIYVWYCFFCNSKINHNQEKTKCVANPYKMQARNDQSCDGHLGSCFNVFNPSSLWLWPIFKGIGWHKVIRFQI